jgi:hypothetical protein
MLRPQIHRIRPIEWVVVVGGVVGVVVVARFKVTLKQLCGDVIS